MLWPDGRLPGNCDNRIILNTPNHRGVGIFWWEPAVTGGLRARGFFDDDGNALPVISVFDRPTRK